MKVGAATVGLAVVGAAGFYEFITRQEAATFAQALEPQIKPWALPIWRWAKLRGLDPFTVAGIVRQESNGNEQATGDNGRSFGLMQVNTAVWGDLATQFNLRDGTSNIRAGTYVLKFAQEEARERVPESAVEYVAIAAFNCGIGAAVSGYKAGNPEKFTYKGRYVSGVLGFRNAYVNAANAMLERKTA